MNSVPQNMLIKSIDQLVAVEPKAVHAMDTRRIGFEGILNTVLGGRAFAGKLSGAGKNPTDKSGEGKTGDIQKLKNILEKLYADIKSGKCNKAVQGSEMNSLTEEEIEFLESFLDANIEKNNTSLDPDKDQVADLLIEFKAIDELLNKTNIVIDGFMPEGDHLTNLQQKNVFEIQDGDFNGLKDILSRVIRKLQTLQASASGTENGSDLIIREKKGELEKTRADKRPESKHSGVFEQGHENQEVIQKVKKEASLFLNKHHEGRNLIGHRKLTDALHTITVRPVNPHPATLNAGLQSGTVAEDVLSSGRFSSMPVSSTDTNLSLYSQGFESTVASSLNNISDAVNSASGNDLFAQLNKHKNSKGGFQNKHEKFSKDNISLKIAAETEQVFDAKQKVDPAPASAFASRANPSFMIEQISGRIYSGIRNGETRINIQLNPPSLGKLDIGLSMKNNQLHAVIVADSGLAKQILNENIDQLRHCFESHNIDVAKISVVTDQDNRPFASLNKQQNERKKSTLSSSGNMGRNIQAEDGNMLAARLNIAGSGSGILNLFA